MIVKPAYPKLRPEFKAVAVWAFNENAGDTAYDISGNNFTATGNVDSWLTTELGSSAALGNNSRLKASGQASDWAKPNTTIITSYVLNSILGGGNQVISNWSANGLEQSWATLQESDGRVRFILRRGTGTFTQLFSSNTYSAGDRINLVAVARPGRMAMWINGVYQGQITFGSDVLVVRQDDLGIGGEGDSSGRDYSDVTVSLAGIFDYLPDDTCLALSANPLMLFSGEDYLYYQVFNALMLTGMTEEEIISYLADMRDPRFLNKYRVDL